ncbi:phosphoglycerate kinase [Pinisolibacter aquiterrae]|uniref:phosphoglycerate kinase n=1 Tax=Pinisolibacter aquiterrae TaxID=2815579 RepID=UPI001C3D48DB|nr:phosphoglycerate kinase [Pinisolibacter aquiterrae]MBV5263551.1 phosphoglycerate kinase [Pinisolibacter aquiterrae]MCC8237395.1 phosphoglycerate kinase [Pinisolibacter aquiterrae]
MSAFKTLDDADVKGKRCLVRVDLNVPMEEGHVTDDTRIRAVLPTITEIADKGGKVILLAHFGRPKNGPEDKYSLEQVVPALASRLGMPVAFAADSIGPVAEAAIAEMADGDVLLLENTRFYKGEEKNDPAHVKALAALGDLYVNDAFATAHRAHASTEGLAHVLPAFAGRCMQAELDALTKALETPERPVAAVVGGAKVSSKLELLGNLVKKVDYLIIGGGMANTFLAAEGVAVGKSLCEHDLAPTAREIVEKAKAAGCTIVLPVDGVAAKEFKAGAENRVVANGDIAADEMVLDAGPASIAAVVELLGKVKTLVWNGPFGAFEIEPFDAATNAVALEAARLAAAGELVAVAGGGDTVSALNHAGAAEDFTYISTAGGAFLEWLEGKALPGVECLRKA